MCKSRFFATFMLLATALPVSAAVVEYPDVSIGGDMYQAFQDDTTSLVWLDLDNFLDGVTTYDSLTALLAGSGFHLATRGELEALQSSMPAIPANFTAEAIIVGGNIVATGTRDLMWGIYEDGDPDNGVSYSWRYGSNTSWSFGDNYVGRTEVLSLHNETDQDLGAWVVEYESAAARPVPAFSWQGIAVLLALFAGSVLYYRRKIVA